MLFVQRCIKVNLVMAMHFNRFYFLFNTLDYLEPRMGQPSAVLSFQPPGRGQNVI